MTVAHRIPKLDTKVLRDLEARPWTEAELKRLRPKEKFHFLKKGKPTAIPDSVILEIRALNQFGGVSMAELSRRYDLSYDYVRKIIDCHMRASLVATRDHLPEGFK